MTRPKATAPRDALELEAAALRDLMTLDDEELRARWPGAELATPAQLRHLVDLGLDLVGALATGRNLDTMDRLWAQAHAARALAGIAPRRADVVAVIEHHIGERLALVYQNADGTMRPMPWLLRARLVRAELLKIDRAFVGVKPEALALLLEKATPPTPRSQRTRTETASASQKTRREKGGRGNVGAAGIAAKLSVACGAFGDTDARRARAAFLAATPRGKETVSRR